MMQTEVSHLSIHPIGKVSWCLVNAWFFPHGARTNDGDVLLVKELHQFWEKGAHG